MPIQQPDTTPAIRLRLKLAIVSSGRSQRWIAAAAGISENRFSEIVRGWTDPRDEERRAISNLLQSSPDDLFGQAHP